MQMRRSCLCYVVAFCALIHHNGRDHAAIQIREVASADSVIKQLLLTFISCHAIVTLFITWILDLHSWIDHQGQLVLAAVIALYLHSCRPVWFWSRQSSKDDLRYGLFSFRSHIPFLFLSSKITYSIHRRFDPINSNQRLAEWVTYYQILSETISWNNSDTLVTHIVEKTYGFSPSRLANTPIRLDQRF